MMMMAKQKQEGGEVIVDVCTRIQPLRHQLFSWTFANFDLFLNGQVNLVSQKFGPFFDQSIELNLSLHNDEPLNRQTAKFTFSVEVKRLKNEEDNVEGKGKQMNLCGQFEVEEGKKWRQNFFIELKQSDKGSTTFELPTKYFKQDTILKINMQYISKQFQRHYAINSKDNNKLLKKTVATEPFKPPNDEFVRPTEPLKLNQVVFSPPFPPPHFMNDFIKKHGTESLKLSQVIFTPPPAHDLDQFNFPPPPPKTSAAPNQHTTEPLRLNQIVFTPSSKPPIPPQIPGPFSLPPPHPFPNQQAMESFMLSQLIFGPPPPFNLPPPQIPIPISPNHQIPIPNQQIPIPNQQVAEPLKPKEEVRPKKPTGEPLRMNQVVFAPPGFNVPPPQIPGPTKLDPKTFGINKKKEKKKNKSPKKNQSTEPIKSNEENLVEKEVPLFKDKYTITSKPTKSKEQQTEPIKTNQQQQQNSVPKPMVKVQTNDASTETTKSQKTKWQQTDEKLLKENNTPKYQQTDDFLFINLDQDLRSATDRLIKDEELKSKVEDFIRKMSRMMRLREVNCVLGADGKAEIAEEFITKLIKLIGTEDGVKVEKLMKAKKNSKDVRKDVDEIKQDLFNEEESQSKEIKEEPLQPTTPSEPKTHQKNMKPEAKYDTFKSKLDAFRAKLDSQHAECLNSLDEAKNVVDSVEQLDEALKVEKTGKKVIQSEKVKRSHSPQLQSFTFDDETIIQNGPNSRSQLLERINAARLEIAQAEQTRQNGHFASVETQELDAMNRKINKLTHEIVTYICMHDLDPVKLLQFERSLRSLCSQMDSLLHSCPNQDHQFGNYRQDIYQIEQNLNVQLTPWRFFLQHLDSIPKVHKNCEELLNELSGKNEEDGGIMDLIKTLEEIDLTLKETSEQIFCARRSTPHLTSHARRHILELEDEQTRMEASCSQLLSQLRFRHKCYPSAGPWLTKQYVNNVCEGISHNAHLRLDDPEAKFRPPEQQRFFFK